MFRPRLTYANVMSTIAVFVALGGTSVAAVTLSKYSVKSRHIAPNAVTSSKVRDGSLTARDFRPGALPVAGASAGPTGQAGPAGPSGPAGADGLPGPAGPAGPVPGDGTLAPVLRHTQNVEGAQITTAQTTVAAIGALELQNYSGSYTGALTLPQPAESRLFILNLAGHVQVESGTGVTCDLQTRRNGGPRTTRASAGVPASEPRETAIVASVPAFTGGTTVGGTYDFRLTCRTGSGNGRVARADLGVVAGVPR